MCGWIFEMLSSPKKFWISHQFCQEHFRVIFLHDGLNFSCQERSGGKMLSPLIAFKLGFVFLPERSQVKNK